MNTSKSKTKQKSSQIKFRNIGYARVSKGDQNLILQIDALKQQGCRKNNIFIDQISGARSKRPGLDSCLELLKEGDILHVWRLDRLGRSMPHLISLIEELKNRGVGFRSVCDGVIDTTTASGDLVFNILELTELS